MKNLFLTLCLLFLAQIGQSQIDTILASQLQTVLDNSVSNAGNNGVSAHVMLPDGTSWSGTAGLGQQNLAMTDTTLFHGASSTKLNVATLVMLLAEEGLIDLDESWSHYLSLNVDFDPLITVRQLLNHTSGIADYLETASSGNEVTADFNHFFTPQSILENIVSDVADFPAGTNFQYSNSNYALAALITEAVTGNPVQTELRNRIWAPLGMNHTYFGAYETYTEPLAGVWWDFGNGLSNYSDVSSTSMLSYAYGAGNIVSCPTDLGLFLSGVLDGQLLSAESLEEMLAFVPASFSSWTAGYGLGIHNYREQTDEVIGHDGYYTNLTDMFHSRNCDFTLVTMTNTQTSWFGIFDPMYDILTNYCNTTNTAELEQEADLMIYPNPTSSQFSITSKQLINEVEIMDATGRVYYRATPQNTNTSLTLDRSGVYFVKLKLEEETISRKLIVN